MTEAERLRFLALALRVVGAVAIFGFYPLTVIWPSGWVWHSGRSEYLEMIMGLYATLGVFLIIAARSPKDHLSLISFAIWSSIVHGAIMAVQSVLDPRHVHHLYGDVLVLFGVAAVLGFLAPEAFRLRLPRSAA
jgi:hypothetical protein